uniref:Uncharacterized protein n=1 Tax=Onchocerca volvulus TaxID=6282 RepID=A0A8R1TPM2_ONCVO
MKIITATGSLNVITGKANEYSALAIRKIISKFIEYGVLHFGVSIFYSFSHNKKKMFLVD